MPLIRGNSPETKGQWLFIFGDSMRSDGVLMFGGKMTDTDSGRCSVGLAGLGGMGAGIARNISRHLFQVAAWEPQPSKSKALAECYSPDQVIQAQSLPELAELLRGPRSILIFGENAAQTDAIIDELLPHLSPRDILIDAGDSYFKDAERRARKLSERSIEFMGVGIAGGDAAARQGAVIMAGGRSEVFARTRSLLDSLAANVDGEASVGYLGSAAAGACFARMVHAGIEYGVMQLVSETFELMELILGPAGWRGRGAAAAWRAGVLNHYLAEISGHASSPMDQGMRLRQIATRLSSVKNDAAARRIAQSARELRVPMPTIDVALGTQEHSAAERRESLISTPFRHPSGRFGDDAESVLHEMFGALYTAMVITYAEGFSLLAEGSAQHGFNFDLAQVALLWSGGCTVRTTLLNDIASAYWATPTLHNLLFDEDLAEKAMSHQEYLRHAVWRAGELEMETPGLLASLDYLDSLRDAWLPVNLVQVGHDSIQAAGTGSQELAPPGVQVEAELDIHALTAN